MEDKNKIILLSISAIFVLCLVSVPPSFAATLEMNLPAGQSTIDFRDIGVTSGFTPVISFDKDGYYYSESGVLTITDHSANVDLNIAETITAKTGDTEILLTETDINTGIFSGPFTYYGDVSYDTTPLPDAARARIVVNLADAGTVTVSDVNLSDGIGCPNEPATQGVNIVGDTLTSVESVTLSYANAVFTDIDGNILIQSPEFLRMHYQSDPSLQYELVTQLFIPGFNEDAFDDISLTIKTNSDIQDIVELDSGYDVPLGSGTYALTSDTGCGGGGGGGISRAGLVVQALGAIAVFGGVIVDGPPTLGLDSNEKRIVDGGFSFNGNPIDVKQYYTPYPLITTPVGQNNTVKLKIYEEKGPDNIAHVGLSYGLGKGETFNEGRVTIEFDRTFDGIESVTVFDPKNVIGSVNVTTDEVKCKESSKVKCLEVTFDHMFRESLEYNMVATNIWDFERNGWQNYFNHGIHIVGESMNPPEQYSGIYRGHIYHLTETGKNTAIDEDGNSWTFDRTWNRDYIKPVKADRNILNPDKILALEKLGFEYSDGSGIFGFNRMDDRFVDAKNQQQIESQTIMDGLCPECQNKSFGELDDILSHDMPDRHSKLENNADKMKAEEQRAQEFLKQYFAEMYPGKVND